MCASFRLKRASWPPTRPWPTPSGGCGAPFNDCRRRRGKMSLQRAPATGKPWLCSSRHKKGTHNGNLCQLGCEVARTYHVQASRRRIGRATRCRAGRPRACQARARRAARPHRPYPCAMACSRVNSRERRGVDHMPGIEGGADLELRPQNSVRSRSVFSHDQHPKPTFTCHFATRTYSSNRQVRAGDANKRPSLGSRALLTVGTISSAVKGWPSGPTLRR